MECANSFAFFTAELVPLQADKSASRKREQVRALRRLAEGKIESGALCDFLDSQRANLGRLVKAVANRAYNQIFQSFDIFGVDHALIKAYFDELSSSRDDCLHRTFVDLNSLVCEFRLQVLRASHRLLCLGQRSAESLSTERLGKFHFELPFCPRISEASLWRGSPSTGNSTASGSAMDFAEP